MTIYVAQMLNCCRTNKQHLTRKTNTTTTTNNNNKLEEIKSNTKQESEKMPTKSQSHIIPYLSCFKKRAGSSKIRENVLSNNQTTNIGINLPDGPSVTYSDSEHLDSLGNLPPFSSKYTSSHLPLETDTPNDANTKTASVSSNFVVHPQQPQQSIPHVYQSNTQHLPHSLHPHHHPVACNCNLSSSQSTSTTLPQPPNTTVATSRRGSLYIFRHTDDLIVTPFAQILASLRNVRANFILITNVHSSREARFGSISTSSHTLKSEESKPEMDDSQKSLTVETLDELEWCLEQLESIQTHRSVSDMASSKFKKILNKELSQYADHTKSGNQISDYICTTFLDKDVETCESENLNQISDKRKPRFTEGYEEEEEEEDEEEGDEEDQKDEVEGNETGVANDEANIDGQLKSGKNSRKKSKDSNYGNKDTDNSATGTTSWDQSEQHDKSQSTASALVHKYSSTKDKSHKLSVSFKTDDKDKENLTYLGINCDKYSELSPLIEESIDVWGIDIFKVATLSDNRPLTVISFALFRKYQLFEKFSIHSTTFLKFISEIERQYHKDVPYHNSTHAADVTQSTNVLLGASPLENVFSDLELMSVILACVVHDVDHPGVTNQYLINTNDQLALLYNDSSVLENHHLSIAFTTLAQPDCDITQYLSKKQRQSFRKMVIDMVLATDMSKHMSLLADLKTMVETKKVAGSGILNLDNYTDRIQILQNMVHCADLSNPTKPLTLYRNWTERIMEEFFLQGDRERQRNLEISPMCDRETATIEKSQVSFIDFIVHPLWETWSDLVYPEAQDILDTLEENRDWYFNQIPSASTSITPQQIQTDDDDNNSNNIDSAD